MPSFRRPIFRVGVPPYHRSIRINDLRQKPKTYVVENKQKLIFNFRDLGLPFRKIKMEQRLVSAAPNSSSSILTFRIASWGDG